MKDITRLSNEELMSLSQPQNAMPQQPDITSLSNEELMAMAAPQQGFLGKTAEALRGRGAQLADIVNVTDQGQQTGIEGAYQKVGTEIGALGDIAGQAISSAAKTGYEALPESAQQKIGDIGSAILESNIGQAGLQALKSGVDAWESFKQNNPRAARNIEATVNVGAFLTPVKGGSAAKGLIATPRVARNIAESGGEAITKAMDKVSAIKKGTTKETLNSDDVKALSQETYKYATETGGVLTPRLEDKVIEMVKTKLPTAKRGTSKLTAVKDLLEDLETNKGKPFDLNEVQQLDKSLGQEINKHFRQGLDAEGKDLLDIQTEFRDMIQNATETDVVGGKTGFEALSKARDLWSASRLLDDIERIENLAEKTDNPATTIKAQFRLLSKNEKRLRGFSKRERVLIEKAAKNGIIPDALRTVLGSRLIGAGLGGMFGGTGGAMAGAVASAGARKLAERGALKQTQKLKKEIIQRKVEPSTSSNK